MSRFVPTRLALLLAALTTLTGCAGLPEAQLDVPPALQAVAPERVTGLGGRRSGELRLTDLGGRFQRSAERLDLFSRIGRDSARVSLDTDDGRGRNVSLRCSGRQVELSVGILSGATRPWRFGCDVGGALQGQLTLQGQSSEAGTRDERQGRWSAGAVQLELRSLHRWSGAAFPSSAPVGYVVLDGTREVGLLELNGPAPRLWRPAPGSPLREHVTHALLALALVWDPA